MVKIVHVAGARPNFMKVAPVMAALAPRDGVEQILVHTGQHYDDALSRVFFDELGIPRPDVNLEVGSGTHAVQTAKVMMAFEPVCLEYAPDVVVVVGDVNSTLACALVAAKLGIRVAHVEAGLRSFDWSMPEEVNRVLTDRLSDFLFTTERSANENLAREGIPADRIHFVGNVMIDTLMRHRDRARELNMPAAMGVEPGGYALVTLHRPSNVDDPAMLGPILDGLAGVAEKLPVLLPLHPRTAARLDEFGLRDRLGGVRVLEPQGYVEFLGLMADARVVITDSGGIQEETTALGVPCFTLRDNTERPVTIRLGTNTLLGLDPARIREIPALLAEHDRRPPAEPPRFWDGRAAERAARILAER